MELNGIKLRFADRIMQEEWADFEGRHRDAIRSRTHRQTGRLEDDRRYWVKKESQKITASFQHPVYERFLDMKKNYFGDTGKGLRTKRNVMTRRRGKVIHNRIIFGKLNPISYRLLNELSDQVREYVKKKLTGN